MKGILAVMLCALLFCGSSHATRYSTWRTYTDARDGVPTPCRIRVSSQATQPANNRTYTANVQGYVNVQFYGYGGFRMEALAPHGLSTGLVTLVSEAQRWDGNAQRWYWMGTEPVSMWAPYYEPVMYYEHQRRHPYYPPHAYTRTIYASSYVHTFQHYAQVTHHELNYANASVSEYSNFYVQYPY